MSSGRDDLPPGRGTQRKSSAKDKLNDMLDFIAAVKDTFKDEKDKYVIFSQILKEVKRTATADVSSQIIELLKGHDDLIRWFNNFVPKQMERDGDEVPRDSADENPLGPTPSEVTVDDAAAYITKVGDTFQNEKLKFNSFIQLMSDLDDDRVDVRTVLLLVKELFEGHDHLLEGFNLFLPKGYEFDIKLDGDGPVPRRIKDTGKAIMCEFNEGFIFCEKVEEQLGNLAQYQKFLKKIMLYPNSGSTKERLLLEVAYILRRHNELLFEFKMAIMESNDCDEFLAGVASKKPTILGWTSGSTMLAPTSGSTMLTPTSGSTMLASTSGSTMLASTSDSTMLASTSGST